MRRIFKQCGKNIDINRSAHLGNGRNIVIGDNSGIGAYCRIPNNIIIGSNVMMASNCVISGNLNHKFNRVDIPMLEQGITNLAPTKVGNDVWIGHNVFHYTRKIY